MQLCRWYVVLFSFCVIRLGHFQLEFAHGREMHPRVGPIDLKLLSMRIGKLTWFCVNLMFIAVSYEYYDEVDPMLMVAVVTQNLFIADMLLFEVNTPLF